MSEQDRQTGHSDTCRETAASTAAPEARLCFVADMALHNRYNSIRSSEPPEIPDGALVELDLFGTGAVAYYKYLLADSGCLGWALDGLTNAHVLAMTELDLILADLEQAEAEQIKPGDLEYWTGLLDRIYSVVFETNFVDEDDDDEEELAGEWSRVLPLVSRLAGQAGRELLGKLQVACETNSNDPANLYRCYGLDYIRALLATAAEHAATLEPKADPATVCRLRRQRPVVDLPEISSWYPLGGNSVRACDHLTELMASIDFATTTMGLSPASLELGFCDNIVHALRGVKSGRSVAVLENQK